MKRTNIIIPIVAVVVLVGLMAFDCNRRTSTQPAPTTTLRGKALGTFYQITIKGTPSPSFEARLDSLFGAANRSMSIFDPASLLSRINRGETDQADPYIAHCITLAQRVSALSDGAYDITIRPLVEAYGFAGKEAAKAPNVDSLLEFVGYEKLSLDGLRIVKADPRLTIDLNSIAKGATVDMVADLVRSEGFADYLVDIGGELRCSGTNAHGQRWAVGVETPFEGNYSLTGEHITKVLRVSEVGMATSGNYRNFRTDSLGNKFTHIINPRTGQNTASNLLSATVVAESCALADAYGTMFISLGLERAKQVALDNHIAALFIYDDGGKMRIFTTPEMTPWLD
jgi:thiamine biosynthesis lipoprotein